MSHLGISSGEAPGAARRRLAWRLASLVDSPMGWAVRRGFCWRASHVDRLWLAVQVG